MPPQVIALYAPCMQSGKDTISRVLDEEFGYLRVKFAEPIKRMVEILLTELSIPPGDISRYIEGDLKERHMDGLGVTPRYMMQTLGNEWGREYVHPDLWVALAMRKVNRSIKAGQRIVIDDMRFLSEFDALKAKGALMVKVVRRGATAVNNHASEGLLSDKTFDVEIINDRGLEELKEEARKLVTQHTV